MERPSDPRDALRAFIDFWVSTHALAPGVKRERLYASFDNDISVLHGYLNAYAEADVTELTWRLMLENRTFISDTYRYQIGRVYDALMLPSMLRIDASSDEAALWARAFLPFREPGQHSEYILKARPVIAARHFHRRGVPPQFAALFYKPGMTTAEMDRVAALYETGVSYEYARVLVEDGMLTLDAA